VGSIILEKWARVSVINLQSSRLCLCTCVRSRHVDTLWCCVFVRFSSFFVP